MNKFRRYRTYFIPTKIFIHLYIYIKNIFSLVVHNLNDIFSFFFTRRYLYILWNRTFLHIKIDLVQNPEK